jgi:acetylglutamate kinase
MSATPRTAVLKFGGEVVADAAALAGVLADVAALVASGWRLVLCHGGGPQANALQERLGLVPQKVAGRRITDAATLQVMKCVLAGELSVDVAAAGAAAGLSAVGLSGVSAGLVTARRRPPLVIASAGPDPIDFGLVGDIVEIRTHCCGTCGPADTRPSSTPSGSIPPAARSTTSTPTPSPRRSPRP